VPPAFASAIASSAVYHARYRRTQQSPSLVSLPSANSIARRFGAFIVPVDGGTHLLGLLALSKLGLSEADIFSLLALPDFLRQERADAQRRPDSGLPNLDVLGQQVTVGDLGSGGELTFGQLPLLALVLVLFSSLLLVGAVLPPGVVARTPVSPASFARVRQPLALGAIAILLPVAFVALAAALS
jgi:hypothetical protein